MTEEYRKVFPVLNQQYGVPRGDRKQMPLSVPWEFAEQFRAQAMINHGQTLEHLADRGGLSPEEIWLAAHGHRLFVKLPDKQFVIDWLTAAIRTPDTRDPRLAPDRIEEVLDMAVKRYEMPGARVGPSFRVCESIIALVSAWERVATRLDGHEVSITRLENAEERLNARERTITRLERENEQLRSQIRKLEVDTVMKS